MISPTTYFIHKMNSQSRREEGMPPERCIKTALVLKPKDELQTLPSTSTAKSGFNQERRSTPTARCPEERPPKEEENSYRRMPDPQSQLVNPANASQLYPGAPSGPPVGQSKLVNGKLVWTGEAGSPPGSCDTFIGVNDTELLGSVDDKQISLAELDADLGVGGGGRKYR